MPKNDKNRRHRPGNGLSDQLHQMRDQTVERQFNLKIAQARKLFNEQKHADALTILEPMSEKFSGRGEFLDLIGACYASAGFLYEAREMFTRALEAPPKHKYRDALNKYNLVRLCAMTGSPFIAYQYSQEIDCELVAEAIERPSESSRCRELKTAVRAGMAKSARDAKMPFDEYVTFSLLLDKGRLEMNGPDIDLDSGILTFEEANRLNPASTTPYNNLTIIYLLQGKLDQAIEKARYLLEHVDAKNIHGLSNMTRLLCSKNQPTEARVYLKRLLSLHIKPSDNLVKVAEALIYFQEDQMIYDRLQPLVRSEKIFSVLKIVDKAHAEQTLIFEIAAAVNAGHRARALELAEERRGLFETHEVLFDRTYDALKNNESGPLSGGRFVYWEPKEMYPQASQSYLAVGPLLLALPTPEEAQTRYETVLRPFFAEYGPAALDYVAYLYWTNRQPEVLKPLLTQTVACGGLGTVELVKRLAFERIGDEQQRLAALDALVEGGVVGREEAVTVWLGRQAQNGTLVELRQRLSAMKR